MHRFKKKDYVWIGAVGGPDSVGSSNSKKERKKEREGGGGNLYVDVSQSEGGEGERVTRKRLECIATQSGRLQ